MRYKEKGMHENLVYPQIPDTLTNLFERRFQLMVATFKPKVFATEILNHFGLTCYFSKISGSELG